MKIKRKYYSILNDVLVFIGFAAMMTFFITFFISTIFAISFILGCSLSVIIARKYLDKFPAELVIEGEKIIMNNLLFKKEIYIKDIVKISKRDNIGFLVGYAMYIINYKGGVMYLESNKYTNLDNFILQINSKFNCN